MPDVDARALIEEFNAAWLRGDLAAVSACLAEDVTYCPNAWDGPAGTARGRAAVADVFAGQLGPGDGPALGAVWATGDRAVCEWAWPPAEDGTVLRGLDVYRVRDGRIVAKDVFGKITS
ncbi:nuclear transport factor 2 family protein [Micromonospora aurantiaca]|uniref:Nuclear transport factor 2 family protein n=1 Tax=Micromonospora aurantiaca (nom. illeg.) TaxID=47850 RepID=A0A6N3K3Q8_9ACTN|nr:nuclear transport factor 2 family protein [Micromonospora aurantiaca]